MVRTASVRARRNAQQHCSRYFGLGSTMKSKRTQAMATPHPRHTAGSVVEFIRENWLIELWRRVRKVRL